MFSFNVVPCLPSALKPLRELAFNLGWTWYPDAPDLFRRLDQDAWKASRNNPVRMLGLVSQARLESAAADDGFQAHLERVTSAFQRYIPQEP